MAGKKIIFTVTNDLTYDQRMQKICSSLSAAGYEVELVGRLHDFSVPLDNQPYRQTRLWCIFNKGKLFYIEYNIRLLFFLLFREFDGVCAIDLDTIAPAYFVGKFKQAKLIYDAHEYFTEVPEVVRRPLVQKVWQLVERTFLPRFDLVYTVSGGLAELFQKKYGRKVEVIMNVPLKETQDTRHKTQDNKVILYQGALNEGRGLEHMIEAMKDIDAKLQLAGEGDLSQQLRELVKKLGLESKVEFLGFVKPEQLKVITFKATIGVNLLENKGLSYYYSLSNKFFDYIHAGVPQVCVAFPEYKHVNTRYEVAVLIDNLSTNEIKTPIERLLTDKVFYSHLQKNCEVCSEVLNWQEEEKKLFALYGHLFG
jgi:glycosyltransferase involved in cell wall biosynthesis